MRVKTEARRKAIIEAAGRLFLEHGFDSVTMAQISSEVGGSKVTLYNYFDSKEAVFEAFVIAAGEANLVRLLEVPEDADLGSTLKTLGCNYLQLVLSPDVLGLDQLIIGEARRIPELSRIFYENGPLKTLQGMDKAFAHLVAKGWLKPAQPRQLTLHFKALCDSGLMEEQLWGLRSAPSTEEITQAVDLAVEAFLHGYRKM